MPPVNYSLSHNANGQKRNFEIITCVVSEHNENASMDPWEEGANLPITCVSHIAITEHGLIPKTNRGI